MIKTIIVLCLALLLVPTHLSHQLHSLQSNLEQSMPSTDPEQSEMPEQSRQLLTITRNSIRITLDSSSFNTITPGPSGSGTTTSTNLAFILRAMQVAINFYMKRLKVYPLSSLIAQATCTSDYNPSSNDKMYGIGASDLHIYVLYKTDKSLAYGATGASCLYYADTGSYPDSTLQIGRPIMGRIIFNTYNLIDQLSSLTNLVFQSITATALHETLHILGFDSTRYNKWLVSDETDPRYGNVYNSLNSSDTPKQLGSVHSSRPATYFLTTPKVKKWAQDFFGCPSLMGMILQNQDSSGLGAGSHWQRTAMYDELMTGTSLGSTTKYFSGLSFAALKDMGWYTVDDTFYDTSNYGYQKGCSFVLDACYSATSFSQFCNAAAMSGISACQNDFFGKAICSNDAAGMADGCGFYGPYSNCIDSSNTDTSYSSYTREAYGTSSFCVTSTLGTVALPSTLTSRCYPYVCGTTSIVFTIGSYSITCQSSDAGTQKTLASMTGSLTCPIFSDFCSHTRKTCLNWCSKNGFCMGGVCNCLPGYYGSDCSKTTCSSGQYYDSTTSSCVTVCPSNYYQNIYSRSCLKCASTCQECYGQPTICIGCISTASNPQYFYNNTCYSACPDGTFADGFNCSACNDTVFCLTCSLNANNCTSCMYDTNSSKQMYLNQPGWGICIETCPTVGTYTLTDIVNHICSQTCQNNLILNSTQCTYCSNNTYKLISTSACVSNCPDYYYADTTNHLCAQCDSSCLTCNGPYAENCVSCSSTATLRYWLLSMCWSICPGGYYPNGTDNACHICPTTINCGNCTYQNSTDSVVCTSCAYGYYLQASLQVCVSQCNSTQFAMKSNSSCVSCNSACLSCTGPSSSTCTSCTPGLKLVQNLTGGYCIATCDPIGYAPSVSNCLACDSSCYTCIGTANDECASCFNGTYLSASYCRLVCPPATYPNSIINQCGLCDGSCTFCFGPTIDNCTGCITGMVLYNFTCRITCPPGYTVNQWNVCFELHLQLVILLIATLLFLF